MFPAPSNVTVSGDSTSSLLVIFGAASNSSSVSTYKATAGDRSCEVAANRYPLSCVLNGLSGGSMYTVQVLACLRNGDCSAPAYGVGYTVPDGSLHLNYLLALSRTLIRLSFIFQHQ